MIRALLLSIGQLGDPRIVAVFLKSLAVTLLLLAGLGAALWYGAEWLANWFGATGIYTTLAGLAAVLVALALGHAAVPSDRDRGDAGLRRRCRDRGRAQILSRGPGRSAGCAVGAVDPDGAGIGRAAYPGQSGAVAGLSAADRHRHRHARSCFSSSMAGCSGAIWGRWSPPGTCRKRRCVAGARRLAFSAC